MKRLYLTVEGQTEQAFAIDVLQPHLAKFHVMVVKPRLTGLHARRRGRIPRGGLLHTFQHSLGDIRRWLREDQSADVRFSTMVDLYSLPKDCPGYDEAGKLNDSEGQVRAFEEALAGELNDSRFIPYIQMHEFEALVLSKPEIFGEWFPNIPSQVASLVKECEEFDTPEQIDHGQHTHPKARIKKHVVDYDEDVDGPLLASDIGLATIRARCPHFNQWLTTLEELDAG